MQMASTLVIYQYALVEYFLQEVCDDSFVGVFGLMYIWYDSYKVVSCKIWFKWYVIFISFATFCLDQGKIIVLLQLFNGYIC